MSRELPRMVPGTSLTLRVAFLLGCMTVIGGVLLALRQQRFELMHDITKQHKHIEQTQQTLWELQASLARGTGREALREAITAAGLSLEPAAHSVGGVPVASARGVGHE